MGKVSIVRDSTDFLLTSYKKFSGKVNSINPKLLRYIHPKTTSTTTDEFICMTKNSAKFSTKPRPVTDEELINARTYLLSKKFNTKITPEEQKLLFSYEGEEFRLKAFDFLTQKMNVPPSLKPQLIYTSEYPSGKMLYDFSSNIIAVNPNAKFTDKIEFLSYLRHEYQHWLQNMKMFGHETKGQEYVEKMANMISDKKIEMIDNYTRHCSLEQLQKMGYDENALNDFRSLKELLKQNKSEEYEQTLKNTRQFMFENIDMPNIQNLRQTVIDEIGIVRADSPDAKRVEKLIQETINEFSGGYFENGKKDINFGKYCMSIKENEAFSAQHAMTVNCAANEGKPNCYITYLKEIVDKELSNMTKKSKHAQDIKKEVDSIKERNITLKELIGYIFN